MRIFRLSVVLMLGIAVALSFSFVAASFKTDQMRYKRVRVAYQEKLSKVKTHLSNHDIEPGELNVYLRVFKEEGVLELWAADKNVRSYKKIKDYEICAPSGDLGPKRKQGDRQVPEGFYHINIFNPSSAFYLSMGVNYPNNSDKILGEKGNLGGDIYIHGDCVTLGCIPITNSQIKELYVFCVEAKNAGQGTIPVTFFPAKLTSSKLASLKKEYPGDSDRHGLWTDLQKGYTIFNKTKRLPSIGFLPNGRYNVTE